MISILTIVVAVFVLVWTFTFAPLLKRRSDPQLKHLDYLRMHPPAEATLVPLVGREAQIEQSACDVGCGKKTLADHERDVAKWLLEADQAKSSRPTSKSRKPPDGYTFAPNGAVILPAGPAQGIDPVEHMAGIPACSSAAVQSSAGVLEPVFVIGQCTPAAFVPVAYRPLDLDIETR